MQEPLLPVRHPNKDFFVCDILDAPLKDDLASMEHPLFSLSTKPDHNIRSYRHNGNSVDIKPGYDGMPTIYDKDIVIYCISQLIDAVNNRYEISRTIRVTAHDILVATNRPIGGDGYRRLKEGLERLAAVRITTDIRTNDVRIRGGFGLVDSWRIVEKVKGRMAAIEITLSEWLYNAVLGSEVLTISPDYFRVRKALDRRLYEIGRKHCGNQVYWQIGLDLLHKKSGSSTTLKEFRRMVKSLIETNHLPDYRLVYNPDLDQVVYYSRGSQGSLQEAKNLLHQ